MLFGMERQTQRTCLVAELSRWSTAGPQPRSNTIIECMRLLPSDRLLSTLNKVAQYTSGF